MYLTKETKLRPMTQIPVRNKNIRPVDEDINQQMHSSFREAAKMIRVSKKVVGLGILVSG